MAKRLPAGLEQGSGADGASSAFRQGSDVRRLGEYYVFAELPARGMTQTFVARKEGRLEICVLKRLLQNLEDNETAVARFGREAKIAAHLEHPRIARMLDASVQANTFCIATEHIIGQPLDAILARLAGSGTFMPLQVAGPLFLGILEGLAYAHDAVDREGRPLSIVHRDLAPSSIVVAFSGDVKIRDFGVARASVDDFKTAPGTAVGSIEYMSPEQARSAAVDRRSDLYTLSAVLYEALANRSVVPAGGLLETLKAVTTGEPVPLQKIRPDLPQGLAAVVEKGLAKDPADRWQSAEEYATALRNELGRFGEASLDVVGDFLRAAMPEEEQKAVELLDRIRDIGERLPAPRPVSRAPMYLGGGGEANEPTMTVRLRKSPVEVAPEEMEPSVMTMPGAPAPLERGAATGHRPAAAAPRARRRIWLVGGVAAVAAVLLLAAGVARLTADRPEASGPGPTLGVQPPAPKVAQKEAAAEATPIPRKAPPPVAKPKRKRRARKAAARRAPPPRSARRSPPPPPAPPPKARPPAPYARIRRQLATLRANPKDVKLFDRVHAAIARAARGLPAAGQRRVKVDLDAAERTYDVELLTSALNKMALERAKAR